MEQQIILIIMCYACFANLEFIYFFLFITSIYNSEDREKLTKQNNFDFSFCTAYNCTIFRLASNNREMLCLTIFLSFSNSSKSILKAAI